MNAELIFELAWKSVLIAGATLSMLSVFDRRSAAERSWIANIGLGSLMLLPLTLIALPQWRLQPPEGVAAVMPALEPSAVLATPPTNVAAIGPAAQNATPWSVPPEALFWTYAVPAGLLVLLLFMAVLRLHLLRRRAEVLVEPQWSTALSAAQRRMQFKHGTALLVSTELQSPISWGVVRPVILLDPKAASDGSQAQAIISHELAHVARLDWAMLIVGRLATAIYWFNPLVWMLARRAHELSEQAVDDIVLNSDIPSSSYAQLLINAACHDNRAVILAANGVTGCGSLARRVERVLDSSISRRAAGGRWVLGCFAAMIFVAGPVAAVSSRGAVPARATAGDPGRTVVNGRPIEIAGGSVATINAPHASVATGSREQSDSSPETRGEILSPVFAGAMITAARTGDMRTLRQLMEHGASVNAVLRGDGTPLIAAVRAGRVDVAAFLLASGANPSLGVPGDGSPLTVAARSGRRDLVELLLSRGASINGAVPGDGTPLIVAAAAGNEDIARLLLDRGASLEQVVPEDENALITASRTGHIGVVALLIGRGANVNSEAFGRTPLSVAQLRGHSEIVDILRKAGAVR